MYTEKQKEEAKNELLKLVKPGATIYTILRHVSRSGMVREIDCFLMDRKGGKPICLSFYIAQMLGYRRSPGRGDFALVVNGCGMDMCFNVVYNMSRALFGKAGGCHGKKALHQEWL